MAKKLVVYYSWSNGNTKRIADKMAEELGADIRQIDTKGSYDEVVAQGQNEVNRGYKPEIEPLDVDIKDMTKECKNAEIIKPMEIKFDSQGGPVLKTSEKKIDEWIADVKNIL